MDNDRIIKLLKEIWTQMLNVGHTVTSRYASLDRR